jgi:hypothetical protein
MLIGDAVEGETSASPVRAGGSRNRIRGIPITKTRRDRCEQFVESAGDQQDRLAADNDPVFLPWSRSANRVVDERVHIQVRDPPCARRRDMPSGPVA